MSEHSACQDSCKSLPMAIYSYVAASLYNDTHYSGWLMHLLTPMYTYVQGWVRAFFHKARHQGLKDVSKQVVVMPPVYNFMSRSNTTINISFTYSSSAAVLKDLWDITDISGTVQQSLVLQKNYAFN